MSHGAHAESVQLLSDALAAEARTTHCHLQSAAFFLPRFAFASVAKACSSPMNRVAICHHIAPRRLLRVIRPSSPLALVPSCNSATARPRGIAKASPVIAPHLLNAEPFRHSPRQFATMASATGFYDFKPLDSTHAMPRKPRAVDPRQH